MRVAVLADIHGNLAALDAVLDDIDAAGVDAIVLNGDLATGPMPAETLDRLAELGERAIWVRGNADRELVAAYDGALNPDLTMATMAPAILSMKALISASLLPETATSFAITSCAIDSLSFSACANSSFMVEYGYFGCPFLGG